jgi:hypothetical protein
MGATPIRKHAEDQSVKSSRAYPELVCQVTWFWTLITPHLQVAGLPLGNPNVLWRLRVRQAFARLSAALDDCFAALAACGEDCRLLGAHQFSVAAVSSLAAVLDCCTAIVALFGATLSHRAAPVIN